MHRQALLNLLDQYGTQYPKEMACVQRYVRFVQQHGDCFERSLAIGHVTGSAWVVSAAGDQVLLHHHRKLDKWLQFGGHADGQSDVLAVAIRETREESGIEQVEPIEVCIFDLDIHTIPARRSEPAHEHFDARFALRVTDSHAYTISSESYDLAWVPVDQLERYTCEPSMLRMRDKWLRRVIDGPCL